MGCEVCERRRKKALAWLELQRSRMETLIRRERHGSGKRSGAIKDQAQAIAYLAESNAGLVQALQEQSQGIVEAAQEEAEEEEEEEFQFLDQEPSKPRVN